jgi:radical SAM protein with 4Fe4S-binding SPASM domain
VTSHLERIRQRAFEQCIPLNVSLELTLRCNLRCVHCYNFDRDLPYHPGRSRDQELSDREVHRILDEVRSAGCLFLSFTGGEAMLHPGLEDFIRHATGAGMAVTLKSNGTLLGARGVDRIASAGASAVDVSLYGSSPETHDSLVKMPGAFHHSVEGARRAAQAGLRTRFSFVIFDRNAAEIPAMIAMASEMGVPYSLDPQISARYDGSCSSLDHRMDRDALERLFRGPLRDLLPSPDPHRISVQCSCARSLCGISAFGEVYPCIGAPLPSGSLRRQSFHDIWHTSPVFGWIRGLRLEDFPACSSCEHMTYCRRSSGVVYSNTGIYNGPAKFGDDWTCTMAEVFHRIHDETPADRRPPK